MTEILKTQLPLWMLNFPKGSMLIPPDLRWCLATETIFKYLGYIIIIVTCFPHTLGANCHEWLLTVLREKQDVLTEKSCQVQAVIQRRGYYMQCSLQNTNWVNYPPWELQSLESYLTLSWCGLEVAAADPPRNTGLGQVFAEGTRQNQETEKWWNKSKKKTNQCQIRLYCMF